MAGWTCPYCNRVATIIDDNVTSEILRFRNEVKDCWLGLNVVVTTCPNHECGEHTINAALHNGDWFNMGSEFRLQGRALEKWRLRPQSTARPFPDYIPAPLREDYEEACRIRDLSPKASATLSRRCLQGMIRDFWNVKERTLFDEINAIRDKIDPAIWQAIDAVRSIGNIGAHMEKDINLVIDVDPDEAQALIQLIEVLFEEWYIARKTRADHLASIVAIAEAKKEQKAPPPPEKAA
ncbi:DUF4145 domain-containing protein [Massilia luteola]|uniref:DUF4145 domain-containing protein n=1 Tax=Massilia luteola TaxID=3081751 RepID=UPI002ACC20A4|nr:DUF4145 domain-containing protein [Massilia sp. Gc5]